MLEPIDAARIRFESVCKVALVVWVACRMQSRAAGQATGIVPLWITNGNYCDCRVFMTAVSAAYRKRPIERCRAKSKPRFGPIGEAIVAGVNSKSPTAEDKRRNWTGLSDHRVVEFQEDTYIRHARWNEIRENYADETWRLAPSILWYWRWNASKSSFEYIRHLFGHVHVELRLRFESHIIDIWQGRVEITNVAVLNVTICELDFVRRFVDTGVNKDVEILFWIYSRFIWNFLCRITSLFTIRVEVLLCSWNNVLHFF